MKYRMTFAGQEEVKESPSLIKRIVWVFGFMVAGYYVGRFTRLQVPEV